MCDTKVQSVGKPFACSICRMGFAHKFSIARHLKLHSGEKPFSCPICTKAFPLKHYLKSHLKIHSNVKPYICKTCNKAFAERKYLNQHSRGHTGEKPFGCSVCEKTFAYRYLLKKHSRVHLENSMGEYGTEKRYFCDTCKKGVCEKPTLISHFRIHSGEKPFICSACGRAFAYKHSYKRHLKICLNKSICHRYEKPIDMKKSIDMNRLYVCDTCNKGFACRSVLTRHIKGHSGVKPYSCPSCMKAFLEKCNLKAHLKTRHNITMASTRVQSIEKNYFCDTCKKGYALRKSFLHHLKVHNRPKLCLSSKKANVQNSVFKIHSIKKKYVIDCNVIMGKDLKIICHRLTEDEIKEYTSNGFLGAKVKQEVIYEMEPTDINLYDNVFVKEEDLFIKQELN